VRPANAAGAAPTLRSGELARRCGISADTLRFYERRGLLPKPQRSANGYRRYPAAAELRVLTIRRALEAGFTIADLQGVLRERDRGGIPCRQVRAIAAERLAELSARIDELSRLRDRLTAVVAGWTERLRDLPEGRRAGLLEGLVENPELIGSGGNIGYPMAHADRAGRSTRDRHR
jgi:DNA-binding transcriptional MerR regulator